MGSTSPLQVVGGSVTGMVDVVDVVLNVVVVLLTVVVVEDTLVVVLLAVVVASGQALHKTGHTRRSCVRTTKMSLVQSSFRLLVQTSAGSGLPSHMAVVVVTVSVVMVDVTVVNSMQVLQSAKHSALKSAPSVGWLHMSTL